ncbi:unnamed protein product [Sphacelaria rigidula]
MIIPSFTIPFRQGFAPIMISPESYRQAVLYKMEPRSTRRLTNAAGLEVVVGPSRPKVCVMPQTRHNKATQHLHTQPRKTRTDTHHSRALVSLLGLANLHTAVYV